MNIALLRTMQARPDAFFWPESLARELKLTLTRFSRDIRELEEFGFGFEHVPHRGVRYAEPARRLCVDQIEWELKTRHVGRRISVWQRTTSTNDVAARAAKSPSNDGLVVLAEEQTAGRGRRHRRWHAPPQSSLLMSVLLFPPPSARSVPLLTSLAALAVADVLNESLELPARIKWPNDVRVAGQKCCGVLVEVLAPRRRGSAVASPNRDTSDPAALPENWRAAVIGIGLNVNIAPHEFPRGLAGLATSIMALCGRRLDRSELARLLIQRLDHFYALARAGETDTLWTRWRVLADLVGERVRVECLASGHRGRLLELWPPRGLTLELSSGKVLQIATDKILSISEDD